MYKEITGDEAKYIHNVVEEYNKDSVLLLRIYHNEQDYENNVYTEIDGSKISNFTYEHSVNSNNYMNFGDVCAACIEMTLMTDGYVYDKALIDLFKEFTIIKPYILQSGSVKDYKYSQSNSRLVKIISQEDFNAEELDTSLDYVTYSVEENDYKYASYYHFDESWVEINYANENNECFNSFPLGKFYVSDLQTTDYYKNLHITAYDVLGFSDIAVGEINDLIPDINYTDQKGLINYFLYKSGMVLYDEGDTSPYCNFATYVSLKLGFGHALVPTVLKKGAYDGASYFVLVGDGTNNYRAYKWSKIDEEWLPYESSSVVKTKDISIMSNKIYFYDSSDNPTITHFRQVKTPIKDNLDKYYEVKPKSNGMYSTFKLFYPNDSVTVRTLISYLAQLGTDSAKVISGPTTVEDVFNAYINRFGELKFVKYNLLGYRDGSNDVYYKIKYAMMLGLTLDGMPNQKVTVGRSRCTSYVVDEASGYTNDVRSIGLTGSSLDLAFPANSSYSSARDAFIQTLLVANPKFPEGIVINNIYIYQEKYPSDVEKLVGLWTAGLEYVQQLRIIDLGSLGMRTYRCVLNSAGEYYWNQYYGLNFYEYLSGQVTWLGDLNLECGDCIKVTDELNNEYSFPIMSLKIEFDGSVKQTLYAKGSTDTNVLADQNISGANSLNSLIKNNYDLIQNGIKKINSGYSVGLDNMALLVDDADLNIPSCLVLSEFSMNNKDHNWLNEGKVVRIDINGIHKSTNGFFGSYNDITTF